MMTFDICFDALCPMLQTSDHYFNVFSVGGDRERMTSNHETYLLMASTQNDMEDWVKSIRRVIWAPFGGGELLQPVCQNKCWLMVINTVSMVTV